ncbi:hypothetical protein Tsubulata_022284 [Turnera subulata]|uniref:S-acyltransferase n=1 Tax=Turnera subulata TaxID=218843 RepID=A0A9Q0GJH8_9ROSI|nr:hypothetical protein Tsubulata_022284 [Turnera subulata]
MKKAGSVEDFEMEPVSVPTSPAGEISDDLNEEDGRKNSCLKSKVVAKSRNILVEIRGKVLALKKLVEDKWLQPYGCISKSDTTRTYQVWPGNNVFFFHGRLVCGPDPRGLLLTTVSILVSSWNFAMYNGDDLSQFPRLVVPFSVVLTIIVLVSLIIASTTDPGIIPRNDSASVDEIGPSNGTRRKRVIVNGVELKLKYCRVCKITRPPRSCHCAICDNCVEKFDHHCPWIGQCIALRNYRFYLMFVVSALMYFIYIFAFSCWRIRRRMLRTGTGLLGMLKHFPDTLALVSFSFAAIWFLGGLVVFHGYLISINQTSYENFRHCYLDSKNPFDKGIFSNIKDILCRPSPSSRVDFRAEAMPST